MSSILKVDQLQDSGGNNIITSNGSGTFTSSLPNTGITMADQWRWTAAFTGNVNPIANNWERNDTNFDKIGAGMSESSGIFTFPQTGIYDINIRATLSLNSNSRYNEIAIQLSTNGGSSFSAVADSYSHISRNTGDTTYTHVIANAIIDVTNTSTHKVNFRISHHDSNTTTEGNTSFSNNCTTFIRLGDT